MSLALLTHFGLSRASATVPPADLVLDTFTDPDGTSLAAHTADSGHTWTLTMGGAVAGTPTADIQSNQLRMGLDLTVGHVDAAQSDVRVLTKWTPAVGVPNRNGVIARLTDNRNFWFLGLREDNGDINIVEVTTAGGFVIRALASYAWVEGTTYDIEFRASGTTLTGYVNGVEQVTYASAVHQAATRCGLVRNTGDDATRFDGFRVQAV